MNSFIRADEPLSTRNTINGCDQHEPLLADRPAQVAKWTASKVILTFKVYKINIHANRRQAARNEGLERGVCSSSRLVGCRNNRKNELLPRHRTKSLLRAEPKRRRGRLKTNITMSSRYDDGSELWVGMFCHHTCSEPREQFDLNFQIVTSTRTCKPKP